jgi:hypothetical protein
MCTQRRPGGGVLHPHVASRPSTAALAPARSHVKSDGWAAGDMPCSHMPAHWCRQARAGQFCRLTWSQLGKAGVGAHLRGGEQGGGSGG